MPRPLTLALRVLLGAAFFIFGLNGFVQFIPLPAKPAAADAFLGAMFATGYLLPLVKATEVVGGLLLLSGRFVPLALVLLAPVIVNIVAFHVFLDPEATAMTLALAALEIALAWAYRDAFVGVLDARAQPR